MRLNSLKLAVCTVGVRLSQGMASELDNVLPRGKQARLESVELPLDKKAICQGKTRPAHGFSSSPMRRAIMQSAMVVKPTCTKPRIVGAGIQYSAITLGRWTSIMAAKPFVYVSKWQYIVT